MSLLKPNLLVSKLIMNCSSVSFQCLVSLKYIYVNIQRESNIIEKYCDLLLARIYKEQSN